MSDLYLEHAKEGRFIHKVDASGTTRRVAKIMDAIGAFEDWTNLKQMKGRTQKVEKRDDKVLLERGDILISLEERRRNTMEKMKENLHNDFLQDRFRRDLANIDAVIQSLT